MAIIKKYNAKNHTTYVYDSVSYWDKELKQPRSKRKLIGKLDPVTGEIVPTAGRGRKPKKAEPASGQEQPAPETIPAKEVSAPAELTGEELRALYEDCRRRLLETEAALAKAESTVAGLTAEKQELRKELEQLLRRISR